MISSDKNAAVYNSISNKYDDYIVEWKCLGYLTTYMNRAIAGDNYKKAMELADKLAVIYHRQGNA